MNFRTFFQENPEYDINSLYNDEYWEFANYQWYEMEYYKKTKK